MLAVDTNVVVRYLTNDDPVQAAIARKLVAGHSIHLPKTVVLESECVLRSLYRFSRQRICAALHAFALLSNVTFEDAEQVARAFGWFEQGMGLRRCDASGLRRRLRRVRHLRPQARRCSEEGEGRKGQDAVGAAASGPSGCSSNPA